MHAGTKPVGENANQRFRVTSDSNVGSSAQRMGAEPNVSGRARWYEAASVLTWQASSAHSS